MIQKIKEILKEKKKRLLLSQFEESNLEQILRVIDEKNQELFTDLQDLSSFFDLDDTTSFSRALIGKLVGAPKDPTDAQLAHQIRRNHVKLGRAMPQHKNMSKPLNWRKCYKKKSTTWLMKKIKM